MTTTTYPPLYKRGVGGEVRVWKMEKRVESADEAYHRVISGIEGGAETASGWHQTEAKNVGRSNATTAETQAEAEIQALYTKKRDTGYWDNVADIDIKTFTKPMLATEWEKRKAKVDISQTVYIQPKLDGIRCIARADGLWSRTGKPIVAVPHVWDALAPLFGEHPDLELDGELYAHHLHSDFNTITSVVRKQAPTEAELEIAEEIEYHVYDVPSHVGTFQDRSLFLTEMVDAMATSVVVCVPTVAVDTEAAIDTQYAVWLEQGYEGMMIRLNEVYQHKRSNFLIKRKDFHTDEFPVVAVEEGLGNWAGCIKRFILDISASGAPNYNGVFGFELPDGTTSGAGVRGTQADMRALLESGQVPDWATVRFFDPTPDGVPRFPVVIDYGSGTRED